MIRRALVLATLLGAFVAPLNAELKYTMTMTVRPSSAPATTPPNPLMTMLSGLVMNMLAPPEGLEMSVVLGERGMRADYNKAYTVVPAGGAMIVDPAGGIVVVNPADKTYWKVSPPDPTSTTAPTVNVAPLGEFATIAGVRAERASVDIRLALPVAPGMPGLPNELVMTGDAWFADQYKSYATMGTGLSAFSTFAMDKFKSTGFLMRSILRSDLFGGREIESSVTSIGEAAVPPGAFEVPPGFTQVDAPMNPLALPGAR